MHPRGARPRTGRWMLLSAVAGSVLLGAWWTTHAAETSQQPVASSESSAKVLQKLDQILEHQQQMLKRFDEVMEELKIIKIRATMRR